MNGFTPEEMSRGGDAAAAVAAVVAAAAAAASAGNGNAAGGGAEVPGAGAVSAAGPPGAAGPGPGQLCCLREDGERCGRAAGNASFSKRIQKSISQKKVKIELDKSVSGSGTALPCLVLPCLVLPLPYLTLLAQPGRWRGSRVLGTGLPVGLAGSPDGNKVAATPATSPSARARARSLARWCGSPPPLTRTPPCLASLPRQASLFLLGCDLETKQRGPRHRGPRVVFLVARVASSGMEAPLFCCPEPASGPRE